MPTNINTFKSFVEFVINKNQNGNTYTTDQFDEVSHQAQMQVFEKDYQAFVVTGNVSDFLKVFLKNKILTVNTYGETDIPTDMEHLASMRHYYLRGTEGMNIPVEQVKNISWGEIQVSQLMKPTKRFPKFQENATTFLFLPRNIGTANLDYFKTPTAPIWAYTTVNNRPVYNSAASVNFEWSEFALNNVAAMFLALVGVNLQDPVLSGFVEAYKEQTNSNF